jgi:FixJ family two-component response regulator
VNKTLIHLAEDDSALGTKPARLIESGGYQARQHRSGTELIFGGRSIEERHILFDIMMHGVPGFAVQKALTDRGIATLGTPR